MSDCHLMARVAKGAGKLIPVVQMCSNSEQFKHASMMPTESCLTSDQARYTLFAKSVTENISMGTTDTFPTQNDIHAEGASPVPVQSGQQADNSTPPVVAVGKELAEEIGKFCDDCTKRYAFNSRWDNVLNVTGILLSVGIVASGVYQRGAVSAILGAFVAAIVSAQKAFPFGQRTNFYRVLIGQSSNLETDVDQGLISKQDAVAILKSLRLDFAQQLPRGSTFNSGDAGGPEDGPKA